MVGLVPSREEEKSFLSSPCKGAARGWPSGSKENSLHQNRVVLAPRSQTSSLQNYEK